MARKNTCKNAVLSERKRSDIFPPLGGTPMRSRLAKCCFCNEVKLKKTLKKRNGMLKYMEKCRFIRKKEK